MSQELNKSKNAAVKQYKNDELMEFKKPEVFTRKPKQKILSEEKYVEVMAEIIQRDFFPHLEILRAQNEYLNAESQCDYVKMAEIRAKYAGQFTPHNTARSRPEMSPASFETPITARRGCDSPQISEFGDDINRKEPELEPVTETLSNSTQKHSIGDKLSLDAFLQCYTSEDNQSFEDIIEIAEAKLREKYTLFYNHEKLSIEKLQNALKLPNAANQLESKGNAIRLLDTWEYKNLNAIMYMPEGTTPTSRELAEADKPVIKHSATRLDLQLTKSSKTSDNALQESAENRTELGKTGKTPRIGGFDLLGMPSPRPGVNEPPIMTWGEIEGTPFRLDGGDTPRPSYMGAGFTIVENSRRENIALELADKAGVKLRAQKQAAANAARKNINSPFIRSNLDRLASMSPAAQRLATGKLGMGNTTPYMKTPTLSPFPTPRTYETNTSSSSTNAQKREKRPVKASTGTKSAQSSSSKNSTARLPQRNHAEDFF